MNACICAALFDNPDCPEHGARLRASRERDREWQRLLPVPNRLILLGACSCRGMLGDPKCPQHGYKATAG